VDVAEVEARLVQRRFERDRLLQELGRLAPVARSGARDAEVPENERVLRSAAEREAQKRLRLGDARR